MQKIEVNSQQALERFLKLTAIEGGSGNERGVADEIIRVLVEAGLDRSEISFDSAGEKTRIAGNCGNLIVNMPGTAPGPRILLSAHMDTVPICIGCSPAVDGDRVFSSENTGLGADNRAGCAAILTAAVERLRASERQYAPAVLLFTVQEEVGLEGARHLDISKIDKVDLAINFDGGAVEKVTVGAIGGERIQVEVSGIPAHAGVAPERGASAIVMAAHAISELDENGWLGRVEKGDEFGTSNVGVISSGDATNVVTPQLTLRAEARSHSPEFRRRIVGEMKTAFETAAAAVSNDEGKSGSCLFSSRVDYEAFRLPDEDPSIQAVESTLRLIGREPYRCVANGGLDANWLNEHGIAAVSIGCGQRNIHTAEEELDIPVYLDACQVAATLIGQSSGA